MFERLCANLSYFKEGPQEDIPDSSSGRILDEDDDPNDEDYTVGIDRTQLKDGALKTQPRDIKEDLKERDSEVVNF